MSLFHFKKPSSNLKAFVCVYVTDGGDKVRRRQSTDTLLLYTASALERVCLFVCSLSGLTSLRGAFSPCVCLADCHPCVSPLLSLALCPFWRYYFLWSSHSHSCFLFFFFFYWKGANHTWSLPAFEHPYSHPCWFLRVTRGWVTLIIPVIGFSCRATLIYMRWHSVQTRRPSQLFLGANN